MLVPWRVGFRGVGVHLIYTVAVLMEEIHRIPAPLWKYQTQQEHG